MLNTARITAGLCFALLLAAPLPVLAGSVLDYRTEGEAALAARVFIDQGRLRIDAGLGERNTVVIHPHTRRLSWIDFDAQVYADVDTDQARRLAALLGNARVLFNQVMAQLSPEDRAAAKKMLGETFGELPQDEPIIERTGLHRQVDGRDCEIVSYIVTQVITGEVCTAAPAALKLAEADARTLEQSAGLLREFGGPALAALLGLPFDLAPLDGVPLRIQQQGVPVIVLSAVTPGELPDTFFTVPPGFRRVGLADLR